MNKDIIKIINSFVVIGVFLFGINTSEAQPRPYLPGSSSSASLVKSHLSLVDIVAHIQSKDVGDNRIMWVNYGSPYFSTAGFSGPHYEEDEQTHFFHAFQYMDMASNFNSNIDENTVGGVSGKTYKQKKKVVSESNLGSQVEANNPNKVEHSNTPLQINKSMTIKVEQDRVAEGEAQNNNDPLLSQMAAQGSSGGVRLNIWSNLDY